MGTDQLYQWLWIGKINWLLDLITQCIMRQLPRYTQPHLAKKPEAPPIKLA